jgi:hypothetical protein
MTSSQYITFLRKQQQKETTGHCLNILRIYSMQTKLERFEVSTAVTMMIIISQKMIIIKT